MSGPFFDQDLDAFGGHGGQGRPREGWTRDLFDGAVERWTGLGQEEVKKLVERSKADLDTVHWALSPLRWLRAIFVKAK